MAEKVVSVVLRARTEGFTAGMSKAKKSVDDLTKAAAPSKADAFGKLADRAALAGVGVATAVGVAVKRFADFDQAMSAVRANSGATGKTLDSLRDAAVKMGADSQFSATEAAQGINEMAKAGVETKDILGGGLKGALDLAAAGQIGVAEAAETAATAMTQFGLTGDKVPHIADLLANAANKAQGGVGDMAQALKQTGLVANAMGLSIEETTAGLTAFASAGLLGSDAGTSFKTMLQRLAAPTGEAQKQMKALNINAYDAQGQFVGLANVAEQLKTGMEDLTPAQRNAALSVIFGSDAVRAANVLYDQGAVGINKWTDAVSEQGAAAKQAAALTDNLKGDIERLGGALDSVFIQTGSSANGSLRGLTQGLTGLVNNISQIPGPVLLAGGALSAFALLAPKGVKSYREYKATLDSLGLSLDKISARAPRTGAALEKVGKGAKVAGAAIVAMQAATLISSGDGMKGFGPEGLTKDLLGAADAADVFNKRIAEGAVLDGNVDSGIKSIGDALRVSFDPSTLQGIDDGLGGIAAGFGIIGENLSDVAVANKRFTELDATLSGLVGGGNADIAAKAFADIARNAQDSGFTVDQVKSKLPQYAEALDAVSNQASLSVAPQNDMADATDAVKQSADDAKDALDNLRSAIEGLGSPLAAQRAAERDFQQSIDDASDRIVRQKELQAELRDAEKEPAKSKEDRKRKADDIERIKKELEDYTKGFDLNTKAGRDNQAALDQIRDSTLKNVTATFDAVNATKGTAEATDAATKAMQRGRDAFIKAAIAAGATKEEAKKLADNLGLVPKDVKIQVSQSGAAAAEEAIDKAARDRTAVITVQRRIADIREARQDAANSDPVRKARGGAIYGAGTATSDSIHALLSNGEHVWTAAEVKALGGQGAMYALRAAVRAGNTPRFAAGGAVAASARMAPLQLTVPSGGADGFGRMAMTGSLTVDGLNARIEAVASNLIDRRERNTNLRRLGR